MEIGSLKEFTPDVMCLPAYMSSSKSSDFVAYLTVLLAFKFWLMRTFCTIRQIFFFGC